MKFSFFPRLFSIFHAILLGLLFTPAFVYSQANSFAPDVASSFLQPDSSLEKLTIAVQDIEASYGPYDYRLKESLQGLGMQLRQIGKLPEARDAYIRALHVARVNDGLDSEAQISIVEELIDISLKLEDFAEVNNHYAYLEHIYKRIYGIDNPKLEDGLRKVVAWHITASNVNLYGNRMEHLRKVYHLLKLRLEIAELTLSGEDPLIDSLRRNIARSEYHMYLESDLYRELDRHRRRANRDRYLANRD